MDSISTAMTAAAANTEATASEAAEFGVASHATLSDARAAAAGEAAAP